MLSLWFIRSLFTTYDKKTRTSVFLLNAMEGHLIFFPSVLASISVMTTTYFPERPPPRRNNDGFH
jgi:hypothetical protein